MALRKRNVVGRSFGPIIQLDDGESVLLRITDIRSEVGPHKGQVIGGITLEGTEVSLTGHAILIDKIERSGLELPACFLVTRGEPINDAIDYEVDAFDNTPQEIVDDAEGKALVTETESVVQTHIDALPPRE